VKTSDSRCSSSTHGRAQVVHLRHLISLAAILHGQNSWDLRVLMVLCIVMAHRQSPQQTHHNTEIHHSTERRHRMQAETRRNRTVAGDQRLPTPLRLPQDNLLQTDPCLRTSSTPVGRRRNFGHLQRLRGRKVALILGQVVAHGHDCEGKQRQLDRSFQALCSPPKAPLRMPLKDDWQEKVGPQRHHRSSKRRLQLCPRAWNHCPSLRNHQSRQQVLWRHLTQTVLHPMTLTAMRCHQSMRCLT